MLSLDIHMHRVITTRGMTIYQADGDDEPIKVLRIHDAAFADPDNPPNRIEAIVITTEVASRSTPEEGAKEE